jgi:PPM family protein phosphatase
MVGTMSDIGNTRKVNQDCIGYFEEKNARLYVIADGMGGHNAGEIASDLAIKITLENVKNNLSAHDNEQILKQAILEANDKIFQKSNINKDLSGMGTTITACLLRNNETLVANVGDSSCFGVKGNSIFKITKDHSLVQELVDNGDITEEEARNHPNKNIITRALGTNSTVDIDIFKLNSYEADKFLLCTDGLTNKVSLHEMLNIISVEDEQESCRKLVQISKDRGSADNISVIVFEGADIDDRNYTR